MRDYADIVSQIRIAAIGVKKPSNRLTLMQLAADAIEEQSKRADELGEELTSAMELVHKRNEKIEQLKAQVPKRGEWIMREKVRPNLPEDSDYEFECSCCGARDVHNENVVVPYCWHCGARMGGVQDALS